jgi:hypothetical protein
MNSGIAAVKTPPATSLPCESRIRYELRERGSWSQPGPVFRTGRMTWTRASPYDPVHVRITGLPAAESTPPVAPGASLAVAGPDATAGLARAAGLEDGRVGVAATATALDEGTAPKPPPVDPGVSTALRTPPDAAGLNRMG